MLKDFCDDVKRFLRVPHKKGPPKYLAQGPPKPKATNGLIINYKMISHIKRHFPSLSPIMFC